MAEINNQNLINQNQNDQEQPEPSPDNFTAPDFSQISEKPKKTKLKKWLFLSLKILAGLIIVLLILGVILGAVYYKNISRAAELGFSAKDNADLIIHKMVNRDFKGAAELINTTNRQLIEAKQLLDEIIIVRYLPYVGTQVKAVDQLLESGIKLSDSGERVILLLYDIIEPLQNESITYANITPQQKKDILNKIVESEDLLLEVQTQIDEANSAIEAIPEQKLVKPLREAVMPLQENLPKVKELIDKTLPMLRVVPKIVGFEESKSYLFLLQNNNELRPTGGFIGTYGILTLANGEIEEFQTDNVYNLDRSTQPVLQAKSPQPIAFYLEQENWALRDANWSPDFPTTAQQALYFYEQENRILNELREQGIEIKGDSDAIIEDTIPYQEVDGVIAMTPEIIEELLAMTGPVVVEGTRFTEENLQEELEFIVGKKYVQEGIARSERKSIIKKLSDELQLRLQTLPLHKVVDLVQLAYRSLDKKQVIFYSKDPELQQMILARGWGGEIKMTDNDYLFVVDSNLGSLKTDQFVDRGINYSLNWQGNDLIGRVIINYQNNADFTWKSTRLRSYTRVYVPQGSQLLDSSGAMYNDKVRDKEGRSGEIDVNEEFDKTVFGAFISIEPHETGSLLFEYKLPDRIVNDIKKGSYSLLVQKQPGVIHNLTLDLNFDKTIKQANPPEAESEWFNTTYNYSAPLIQDSLFIVNF